MPRAPSGEKRPADVIGAKKFGGHELEAIAL